MMERSADERNAQGFESAIDLETGPAANVIDLDADKAPPPPPPSPPVDVAEPDRAAEPERAAEPKREPRKDDGRRTPSLPSESCGSPRRRLTGKEAQRRRCTPQ